MKTCFISNILIYILVQELELCKKRKLPIFVKQGKLSSLKKLISLLEQEAETGDRYLDNITFHCSFYH